MSSTKRDNNSRTRNRRTFDSPLTAIGWASMLLAVSGVSAYGVGSQKIPSAGTRNSALMSACANSYVGISTDLTGGSRGQRGRSSTTKIPTRLHYRDSDEEQSDERRQKHDEATSRVNDGSPLSKWWTVNARPANDKQKSVDAYLEFLDRRYNRLHSGEKVKSSKSRFSAWNWLMEGSPANDEVVTTSQQDDALYVLGVAELASERLLQKHHLQMPGTAQKPIESGVIIDAVSVLPDTEPSKTVLSLVHAGSTVLARIQARRKALIAYQSKKLQEALSYGTKALLAVPKKAVALWKMGGGTQTLALTVSVAAVFLFILRPMVQAIMYEAVGNAGRSA